MCNACGFSCCAMDCFEGCGCEHCEEPECWQYCESCQEPTWSCSCGGDEDYDDEEG